LIVGLFSSTQSRLAVVGGILVIAIADSLSDALGIHVSEESENKHTAREIWESTFSTWAVKAFVVLSFLIPILLFPLEIAVVISMVWGFLLLGLFSWYISGGKGMRAWKVVGEHFLIAAAVVVATYFVGGSISKCFG